MTEATKVWGYEYLTELYPVALVQDVPTTVRLVNEERVRLRELYGGGMVDSMTVAGSALYVRQPGYVLATVYDDGGVGGWMVHRNIYMNLGHGGRFYTTVSSKFEVGPRFPTAEEVLAWFRMREAVGGKK